MILNKEMLRLILGFKLRGLRKNQNLSLKELSLKSGLSPSYLNEIEQGKKYPRSDKITLLSQALSVPEQQLSSFELNKEFLNLSQTLKSQFVTELPLELLGFSNRTIFQSLTKNPKQMKQLLATFLEIMRIHSIQVEDFFIAILRGHLNSHDNFFPQIEEKVKAFKTELNLSDFSQLPPVGFLVETLNSVFGKDVIIESFDDYPLEIQSLTFFCKKKGSAITTFINGNISPKSLYSILLKEIAFSYMKLKERPLTSNFELESLSQLYNDFQATYFSNAFLIPQQTFIGQIKNLFLEDKWDGQGFSQWIQTYSGTTETFFQRLTQVLPTFFNLKDIFYLKFYYDTKQEHFYLSQELHLSQLHSPHEIKNDEQYCRRWITTSLLQNLCKDNPRSLTAGIQRSFFIDEKTDYLCLSVAEDQELNSDIKVGFTLGISMDENAKRLISFSEDSVITRKEVGQTCERCSISNCEQRASPMGRAKNSSYHQNIQNFLEQEQVTTQRPSSRNK